MARLCPLFSGSKGNSTYIGSSGVGILIDAGKSAKQIELSLKANDIDISSIKAIFVTHEHTDHIQGIRVFASRYNIKTFASEGTINALIQNGTINGKFPYEPISKNGIEFCGMFIKPFRTPHDSQESTGYIINTCDGRTAAIATDIGYLTTEITEAISGSDTIVIESNHDIKMLQNGPYPYYLKRRILSNTGHLSNESCAEILPSLVKKGTTRFVLAHLSSENNIPELAYQTSICNLSSQNMSIGRDFDLFVAPKENFGQKNVFF